MRTILPRNCIILRAFFIKVARIPAWLKTPARYEKITLSGTKYFIGMRYPAFALHLATAYPVAIPGLVPLRQIFVDLDAFMVNRYIVSADKVLHDASHHFPGGANTVSDVLLGKTLFDD